MAAMVFKPGDKVLYRVGFMNEAKVFTFIEHGFKGMNNKDVALIEDEDGFRVHVSVKFLTPVGINNKEMACMLEKE